MAHRTPRPVWPGHIRPQHGTQNTQPSVARPHQTTTWYTEHPDQCGRATSDHSLVHRTPRPVWPDHIRPQHGTQNTQTSVAGPHQTTTWYTEHPDQCGWATSDHNMAHRTPRPVWPGHIRPQPGTQNTHTSVAGPHQTTTWYTEHPDQCGRATSDHNLVHRTPIPVWLGLIRSQPGTQNTQTSVAGPHQTTTWHTEHPDQCGRATSDHSLVHRTPRPVWPGHIRLQPGTQNTQTSVAGPHQTTAWYTEHPDQCGRATSDHNLVHRTPRPVWPGHIRPQPGTQNTQTSVARPHQTTTWYTEHPDQCGRATSDHNMVHRTPRPVWLGHIRPQHGTQNTQTSVAGPHQTTTWYTEHPYQCGRATSDHNLVHRTPRPVWPGHIRPQPGTQNTHTSVAGPHQITAWYTEHPDQCGRATSDHNMAHRTPRPVWPGHIRPQPGTQNTQTSVAGPHQTTTWHTEHPDRCGRATSDHNMVHRTPRPVWLGHIRPQHGTQNTQTSVAGPHQTTAWYTEHPDQCGQATSDHSLVHRTPRPVWPGHIRPQHGTQNTQTSVAGPHQTTAWYTEHPDQCGQTTSDHNLVHRTPRPVWPGHIRPQPGTQNTQTSVARPHQTATWYTEHPDQCGQATSDHNLVHRTPRPVWPPTTSDNNMAQGYRMREADTSTLFLNTICPGANRYWLEAYKSTSWKMPAKGGQYIKYQLPEPQLSRVLDTAQVYLISDHTSVRNSRSNNEHHPQKIHLQATGSGQSAAHPPVWQHTAVTTAVNNRWRQTSITTTIDTLIHSCFQSNIELQTLTHQLQSNRAFHSYAIAAIRIVSKLSYRNQINAKYIRSRK